MCLCGDGPVMCHTGRTKRKRLENAAVKREGGAEGDLTPKPAKRASGKRKPSTANVKALALAAASAGARLSLPLAFGSLDAQGAPCTAAEIQTIAAQALIACMPAHLMDPSNATLLTAANAAAAAFAVVIMPAFAGPPAAAAEPGEWDDQMEAAMDGGAEAAPEEEADAEVEEVRLQWCSQGLANSPLLCAWSSDALIRPPPWSCISLATAATRRQFKRSISAEPDVPRIDYQHRVNLFHDESFMMNRLVNVVYTT
jgi:hypothetical protein